VVHNRSSPTSICSGTRWPTTSPAQVSMRWEGKLTPRKPALSFPLQKLRAKTGFPGRQGTDQQLRFDGSWTSRELQAARIRLACEPPLHPWRFPGQLFWRPRKFLPAKKPSVAAANRSVICPLELNGWTFGPARPLPAARPSPPTRHDKIRCWSKRVPSSPWAVHSIRG